MDYSIKYPAKVIAAAIAVVFLLSDCVSKKDPRPYLSQRDTLSIIRSIVAHRAEMDDFFRTSPYSPFAGDTSVKFEGIKWYPPSLEYYFRAKLVRYPDAETVSVFGTKGEERSEVKYGYFEIFRKGQTYRLNVYKDARSGAAEPERPLSIWFTDETTAKETYGVGRYLEVGEEQRDSSFFYTLDFNNAYNPYCAYSGRYSCAIPRKEDHLAFPLLAGEVKYHQ